MVRVKICGLNSPQSVAACVEGGADYVGFVFFPPSPRFVTPEQAGDLAQAVPKSIKKVGLFVDADDAAIEDTLVEAHLDILQLHGKETPERIAHIKAEFGKPVMKVFSVSSAADIDAAKDFYSVVDLLLFDAKPPKGSLLPGGNAVSFDWNLLAGRRFPCPWMLAGGLNIDNLAEAVRQSGANRIDASSGVEDAPGQKSPSKIKALLELAHRLP